MRHAEEHLLEQGQVHGFLAARVINPLLGDLTRHLILAVERQQDLVDALEQRRVLLLRHAVARAVRLGLRVQQLPVARADVLEVRVVQHLLFVGLGDDRVHRESCERREQLELTSLEGEREGRG